MSEATSSTSIAPDTPSWQGPCAPGLAWSEALTLSMPVMDDTHEAFVALLASVQTAPNAELTERWRALVAHTREHFAREDAWMLATGFAPGSCHMTQHQVVLQVLEEGLLAGEAGQLAPIRQMAHELTIWFPHHAASMDTGLALHLKSVGCDPITGEVGQPDALPPKALSGCGGAWQDERQATA
jgi:hemerythrin-like metal-binding protein